jgi:hypothetical protein
MCFDNHKKQLGGGKKGFVNILGTFMGFCCFESFLHVVCSVDV